MSGSSVDLQAIARQALDATVAYRKRTLRQVAGNPSPSLMEIVANHTASVALADPTPKTPEKSSPLIRFVQGARKMAMEDKLKHFGGVTSSPSKGPSPGA